MIANRLQRDGEPPVPESPPWEPRSWERRSFENAVTIEASVTAVERCFTELDLMTRWLNPMLRCQPTGGPWSTEVGSESSFVIRLPILQPTLKNVVIERATGLVVWRFEGFFVGTDRWECQPLASTTEPMTRLLNRFTCEIPNPWVRLGFDRFARSLTEADMQAQLDRIKTIAEALPEMHNIS